MRLGRPIPMLVLALALAAYGFDCPAASSPDEAMQCCDDMPCPSHGHDGSQDCCNTAQATHAPFVKQASISTAHFSPVLGFVMLPFSNPETLDFSTEPSSAAFSHSPPISPPGTLSPLRI